MPLALIIIGLCLIVSGARGTYPQLKELLISDLTGPKNFLIWIVALGGAGSLGYVPALEKFSRVFLGLLILSIFLAERGFFNKFMDAINSLSSGSGSTGVASPGAVSSGIGSTLGAIDNATGSNAMGSFVTDLLGRR